MRANAQCPGCYSLERHRLIWVFLEEKKLLVHDLRLLHVAPEECLQVRFKACDLRYFPIDKFEEGYRYPRGTTFADITALRFDDNSFDAIICSHVLEHIVEDQKAINELNRVLKPGGWALLQVPIDLSNPLTLEDRNVTDPRLREELYGQFDHVRMYGKDYVDRLQRGGFNVDVVNFKENLQPSDFFKYGLEDDPIFYCFKQPLMAR